MTMTRFLLTTYRRSDAVVDDGRLSLEVDDDGVEKEEGAGAMRTRRPNA